MNNLAKILTGSALIISVGFATNAQRIMDWSQGYQAPQKPRRDLGPMPAFKEITEVATPDAYRTFTSQRCAVVDYNAPWCIPCRTLKPDLAEIAREHRTLPFGSVDIDDLGIPSPKLKGVEFFDTVEGIQTPLPQIVFYVDGAPVAQTTGYAASDREQLETRVAEFAKRCSR